MTPKVLYSCMAYIKKLTMAHNRKLLDMQEKKKQMCGCKKKKEHPVNGKYLAKNLTYRLYDFKISK